MPIIWNLPFKFHRLYMNTPDEIMQDEEYL